MAGEIYGALSRGQALSLHRTHPGKISEHQLHNPHWVDKETEAGDCEVAYSPSLSCCEARLGWNPRPSEAPHHTLLLRAAQEGRAECWGGVGGQGMD